MNPTTHMCKVCSAGFIGYKTNYCLLKTTYAFLKGSSVPSNCKMTNSDGDCLKCSSGYYLDGISCVNLSTCSTKSI